MGKIFSSIRIDEDLWREAKIEALKKRKTITCFVEESIREKLGKTK